MVFRDVRNRSKTPVYAGPNAQNRRFRTAHIASWRWRGRGWILCGGRIAESKAELSSRGGGRRVSAVAAHAGNRSARNFTGEYRFVAAEQSFQPKSAGNDCRNSREHHSPEGCHRLAARHRRSSQKRKRTISACQCGADAQARNAPTEKMNLAMTEPHLLQIRLSGRYVRPAPSLLFAVFLLLGTGLEAAPGLGFQKVVPTCLLGKLIFSD